MRRGGAYQGLKGGERGRRQLNRAWRMRGLVEWRGSKGRTVLWVGPGHCGLGHHGWRPGFVGIYGLWTKPRLVGGVMFHGWSYASWREEVWARKYGQSFTKRSGRGLLATSEGEDRPRKIMKG